MNKYLISGIGPGDTGVGRLMKQLVVKSEENGYKNIYNFASKPIRQLKNNKKYIQLIIEIFLRLVNSIIFNIKINSVKNSEVILIYPQGIGLYQFKKLVNNNTIIKMYIMDNSFFCMKSYNYLNGECLRCLDNFENYDKSCSPAPRPFNIDDYIKFLNFLKNSTNKIKFFSQSQSHKNLIHRVYGMDASIETIGMNTGEFDFAKRIHKDERDNKKTIVFHNHLVESKGFNFALDIAINMKQYNFIFPSKKPQNMKEYNNIKYIDVNWDNGLKEIVVDADLILCLSMWSTPIEGALVKSLYYNGNVAIMDNEYGFSTEIPNDCVLKLSYELSKSIEIIECFMKNNVLDLSINAQSWLKTLYDNYHISKLFEN